eukprot:1324084-Amphidinium_carterae.1
MAWENPKAVALNSLEVLGVAPGFNLRRGGTTRAGRRGGTLPSQQPVHPGSKKWSAQARTGWNCPHCEYYKFGFCTSCFLATLGRRYLLKRIQHRGKNLFLLDLPSLGSSWSTRLPNRTDPTIKEHLTKAFELKKKAAEGIRELPLKDKRAHLIAQALVNLKRLAASVNKKQKQIAKASAELQELRKELAVCYVDIKRHPEEVLPLPHPKVLATAIGPPIIKFMNYVKQRRHRSYGGAPTCSGRVRRIERIH